MTDETLSAGQCEGAPEKAALASDEKLHTDGGVALEEPTLLLAIYDLRIPAEAFLERA